MSHELLFVENEASFALQIALVSTDVIE